MATSTQNPSAGAGGKLLPYGLLRLPAAAVFVFSLAGYSYTLRPTFGWGDTSELATAVRFLGIGHSPGYPTFVMLAHAFSWLPLGDFAHRMNLFSATCGALAVLLAYAIFLRLTKSKLAAFVSAAAFAFSYTFWDATTELEVHTLHLCLVGGLLLLLLHWRETGRDRFLYLAALLFGIGLGNHPLIALFLPGVCYLVIAERGLRFLLGRHLLFALGFIVLGLSVYLYVPLRAAHNPPPGISNPHTLTDFFQHLTSPGSRSYMFSQPLPVVAAALARYPYRILNEFSWPGLALGLLGLPLLWWRDRRILIFALLAIGATIFYAANYAIFDIYQYYLQTYLLWALFIAFGLAGLLDFASSLIARLQGSADWLTPERGVLLVGLIMLTFPFCQFTANLQPVDASQDYSAEDYARAVLSRVEPNSLIFADWWPIAPLGYLKYVEGQRKDVTLIPGLALARPEDIERHLDRDFLHRFSAVYAYEMITVNLPQILEHYPVIREGPLFRVIVDPPDPRSLEVPASSIASTPRADFGSELRLLEANLEPKQAVQGSCLTVDYIWTRSAALDAADLPKTPLPELDTLTQVKDSRGKMVWLDKGPLLHALYPTSEWKRGQAVRERHVIYLDSDLAPGCYQVTLKVRARGGNRKVLPVVRLSSDQKTSSPVNRGELAVGSFEVTARHRPPSPGTLQRLL